MARDHIWLVEHFARRMSRDPRELDDCLSDANFGLQRALETYNPDEGTDFRYWAGHCVWKAVATGIRRRSARSSLAHFSSIDEERVREPADTRADSDVVGKLIAREEREAARRVARRCLALLEPRDRRIAVGIYLEGRSRSEMAAELGVSAKLVSNRLSLLRAQLRAIQREKGDLLSC